MFGATHVRCQDLKEVQVAKASFYADKFENRKMSNGSKFHQARVTAASLKFPLGTHVRIRSLDTGQEILAEITDRGPWSRKYALDLSKAAFNALGINRKNGWGWVVITEDR